MNDPTDQWREKQIWIGAGAGCQGCGLPEAGGEKPTCPDLQGRAQRTSSCLTLSIPRVLRPAEPQCVAYLASCTLGCRGGNVIYYMTSKETTGGSITGTKPHGNKSGRHAPPQTRKKIENRMSFLFLVGRKAARLPGTRLPFHTGMSLQPPNCARRHHPPRSRKSNSQQPPTWSGLGSTAGRLCSCLHHGRGGLVTQGS